MFNIYYYLLTGDHHLQVALQAIFSNPDGDAEEESFKIDEDEQGFSLRVVPHPGDAEANFVWADLGIRFVDVLTDFSDLGFWHSFTQQYEEPWHPASHLPVNCDQSHAAG